MFTKTLLPDTFRAIQLISSIPEIQHAYLAGGTALALQLGHRMSVDLDFFTQQEIDENVLAVKFAQLKEFQEDQRAWRTLLGTVGATKMSIFFYEYPLLEQTVGFENIHLASPADIAAMKINAIESRGTRRDFIDVYFLAKRYSLETMLDFYQKKYGILTEHFYAILRSLDYFEDAEKEMQMPQMLVPVNWEEVKEFFRAETKKLSRKL